MTLLQTLLFFAGLVSFVSSEAVTRNLALISVVADKGKLRNENLDVLNINDQQDNDDNWDKYIEIDPGRSKKGFVADFEFQYVAGPNDEKVEKIEIVANTKGSDYSNQRRYFQIQDFSAQQWVYLDDNEGAPSWKWYKQSFVLEGVTLAQYFSSSHNRDGSGPNVVGIRFRSDNKQDACNVDYLAVIVTVTQRGAAPTPQPPTLGPVASPRSVPTGRPSRRPTSLPSFRPTKGPTPKPTLKPTSKPTSKPTQRPMGAAPTPPVPVAKPTKAPTSRPISNPTKVPTFAPSAGPDTIAPVALPSVATRTLSIQSAYAAVGSLSNQGLSVLSNMDMSGTEDDWYTYVEANPGGAGRFEIVFEFVYDRTDHPEDGALGMIEVHANTIGDAKTLQLRQFELYDFVNNQFLTVGDNDGASGWVWYSQSMYVDSTQNLERFVDPQGKVRVVFTSSNSYDVSNVDYLVVKVVVSTKGGGRPTHASPTPPAPTPRLPTPPSPTPRTPTPPAPTPRSPTSNPPAPTPTNQPGDWWKPKAGDRLTWQWQLTGPINDSFNVNMYDIDLFDNTDRTIANLKAQGRKVVCYFSAGTYEGWRPDWKVHFPFITSNSYTGNKPPFAGKMEYWDERWLDIRRIDLLEPIMRARLQMAKDKGCDAVEPDNMDAYSNSRETGVSISYEDQIMYNRWLADAAHEIGMSIGLKNDVDQLADLEPWYDWAINEECFQWNECEGYSSTFIAKDKAVFGVEYQGNTVSICKAANAAKLSWLIKDLDLGALPRTGCEDYQ